MEEEQKQEEMFDLDKLSKELDFDLYSDIDLLDNELKEIEEEI